MVQLIFSPKTACALPRPVNGHHDGDRQLCTRMVPVACGTCARLLGNSPMDSVLTPPRFQAQQAQGCRTVIAAKFHMHLIWSTTCLVCRYRHTSYHKQTKNQWARDDPAFLFVTCCLLAAAATAYGIACALRSPPVLMGLAVTLRARSDELGALLCLCALLAHMACATMLQWRL